MTPDTPFPSQMAQRSSCSSDTRRLASVTTLPEPDGAALLPLRRGSTPPSDARRSRASRWRPRRVALAAGTAAVAALPSIELVCSLIGAAEPLPVARGIRVTPE